MEARSHLQLSQREQAERGSSSDRVHTSSVGCTIPRSECHLQYQTDAPIPHEGSSRLFDGGGSHSRALSQLLAVAKLCVYGERLHLAVVGNVVHKAGVL